MTSRAGEAALWLYEFVESAHSGDIEISPEIILFLESALSSYEEAVVTRLIEDVLGDG